MRDFVLHDGFLRSCIDLPRKTRERVVSQLRAFSADPRDRDLGVARVEESKHVLLLPIDDTYRILLRREKPVTTLLAVTESNTPAKLVTAKRGIRPDQMVIAPVDALATLLVEEKYLLLAKYLLRVPATTRELRLEFSEIEKIVNTHLPPEARRFHNWWANQKSGKRAHAFSWMAAGWLVSEVDIDGAAVKFTRRNPEVEGEG
jgi:hypothetical protein